MNPLIQNLQSSEQQSPTIPFILLTQVLCVSNGVRVRPRDRNCTDQFDRFSQRRFSFLRAGSRNCLSVISHVQQI